MNRNLSARHVPLRRSAVPVYLLAVCVCTACGASEPETAKDDSAGSGAGGQSSTNASPDSHGGLANDAVEGTGGPAKGDLAAAAGIGNGADAGAAGADAVECETFNPTGVDCGSCEQSLDEYCDAPDKCHLMAAPECRQGVFNEHVEAGCGYLRISWSGDVGDEGVTVYDSANNLVFERHNGRRSSGCFPALRVGKEPSCNSWTDACAGDGGAGGGGGAAGVVGAGQGGEAQ